MWNLQNIQDSTVIQLQSWIYNVAFHSRCIYACRDCVVYQYVIAGSRMNIS